MLIVAASGLLDKPIDARRDKYPDGRQRRHHRPRLTSLGALLRGHDERALLPQHREDRGEHVDPEVCRRQRKRGERVGPRAGNRCHRQRHGVVGNEVQQERRGVDVADRLATAEQPNDGEAHVDQDRPPREEVQA